MDSTDKKDSAFFYFNNVTETSNDSALVAMAYAYMAFIQQDLSDFFGVQESAFAGIRHSNEDSLSQHYCLASLYNLMGRSYVGLKNYDAAISYYNIAMKFQHNESYKKTYLNNIAVALREKGDYSQALKVLLSIKSEPNENQANAARAATNLASLKWKVDKHFNPVPDLHKALHIRLGQKDDISITSSYHHLADYYQTNNPDSALYYAKKMYALAQKTNSVEDQMDAIRKLKMLTHFPESRALIERYDFLSDSIQTARSAATNQFALIRYESEKSKAENMVLQEENAQKKLQILRQRLLVYGSAILALLIIAGAVWLYRKKKQQVELKSQATIQETQLNISQKVHDIVANGLYRIMTEIEHRESIEKEPLLDRIEELYERSRDISYEPLENKRNYSEKINHILTSFARSTIKVSVVGNQENLWSDIAPIVVKEIEQVLQELMVNMAKHSGAKHVVLHFTRSATHLDVLYKDDGRGFLSNFQKGNGLKSTETRINRVGGQITFTNGISAGSQIKIIVPISLK